MKYFLILVSLAFAGKHHVVIDLNEFCTGTVNSRQFCILMASSGVVNDQSQEQYGSFSAMMMQNPALKARFQAWLAKKNGVIPGKPVTTTTLTPGTPPPPAKKKLDAQFDRLDSMMRRSDSLLNAKLSKDPD